MNHVIPAPSDVAAELIELFICDHVIMGDMGDSLYEEFQAWCAEGDRWEDYVDVDGLDVQTMIDEWLKKKEVDAEDAKHGYGDYLCHLHREG
jgi:hypothetical protein